MATTSECPMESDRSGCRCGAVNRGKPEVPVEWLKQTWRSRGLLKNIQLTISCCLVPCNLPNVVTISGSAMDVRLGKIGRSEQYISLVERASQSKAAGVFLPLPEGFASLRFNPFRAASAVNTAPEALHV